MGDTSGRCSRRRSAASPIGSHRARDGRAAGDVHFETVSSLKGQWVEVNIYPSGAGLSVYFRDISERKQAEQAERTGAEHSPRIADTLQTALLQTVSENAFPGLAVSTLYKAASDEALVGGDFFDAFTVDRARSRWWSATSPARA